MIYLDNAATSYPKPPCVHRAVRRAMEQPLGNPGRSTHDPAMAAAGLMLRVRQALGAFFDCEEERVVFTLNTSQALNLAIFGIVKTLPPHKNTVLTDHYQHNSVLRPLYALEKAGTIRLRFCSVGEMENGLDESVGLGVFSALSNVTGEVFPVGKIARSLHRAGALFLCDGAQGAGRIPLSLRQDGIDLLCVPAHKGLLGVTGAGALLLGDACPLPAPHLFGGTGSAGQSPEMPELLPDRLEVGTPALLALAAWEAGLSYVQQQGIDSIAAQEKALTRRLHSLLSRQRDVILYSPEDAHGIVLCNRVGHSPHALADALNRRGICVRSGFHCAPLAHRLLNTGEDGALRFSFGPFNTPAQTLAAAEALLSPAF